jgi:hypothetical protein
MHLGAIKDHELSYQKSPQSVFRRRCDLRGFSVPQVSKS